MRTFILCILAAVAGVAAASSISADNITSYAYPVPGQHTFSKCSGETGDSTWKYCMEKEARKYVSGCPSGGLGCRLLRLNELDITREMREELDGMIEKDRKDGRDPFREVSHGSTHVSLGESDWWLADRECMVIYDNNRCTCDKLFDKEVKRREKLPAAFAAKYVFPDGCGKDELCECWLDAWSDCISECWDTYWDVHDKCLDACSTARDRAVSASGVKITAYRKLCIKEE